MSAERMTGDEWEAVNALGRQMRLVDIANRLPAWTAEVANVAAAAYVVGYEDGISGGIYDLRAGPDAARDHVRRTLAPLLAELGALARDLTKQGA